MTEPCVDPEELAVNIGWLMAELYPEQFLALAKIACKPASRTDKAAGTEGDALAAIDIVIHDDRATHARHRKDAHYDSNTEALHDFIRGVALARGFEI